MPWILTPRQLQQRAELHQQLGQLTAAGITLLSALELLERNAPARGDREPLRRIQQSIRQGSTLTAALRGPGRGLPAFDIALVHAGEQSGRLPECFRLLAGHYAERAQLARQVLGDLAYPLFVLHLAVFLLPFSQLFVSGDWLGYLARTLGVLAPLYTLVLLVAYAVQGRRGERWRETLEALLHPIPVLGAARRALALARLAAALEALLSAGVTVIQAWEIAALACGSPLLRRSVAAWKPHLLAGQTPADTIAQSRIFPELFANLYHTGEISGQLDESLRNLHRYYQEEGTRKLRHFACWAPRLFYLLVALLVAWKVVRFWAGIYGPGSPLDEVLKSLP
jgi:type II secretory pathway component PulF